MGLERAMGEVFLRLDAHCFYPPNYIGSLASALKRTGADNVGAVCITQTKFTGLTANAITKVLSHPLGVGGSQFRIGADEEVEVDTVPFGCFKMETIKRLGGYNAKLDRNQDIELNKRILAQGGRIVLIPSVKCVYFARDNWIDLAKNNFQNGKWNLLTVRITGKFKSLSLRHFIPLLFVLFSIIWVLLIVELAFYALALLKVSFNLRTETTVLRVFWSFVVLHFSYGIGSMVGLFLFLKY
jgi:hypothetical protein